MIGRIGKVRKRDGRLVEFDETKIADAIHKAACAVGGGDRFLAEELAGVVTLFLEKRYSGAVPGIEEIQDMVEKVLIETGHARMAKAYILYRERRARAREQVVVHRPCEPGPGPRVGNPAKAQMSSWSKGRIADALVREADLDAKVAAEVAAGVEEKVFSGKVTSITTSAIRSLVEAELFLMGYSDRVGKQAIVGLPKYDVDGLLRGHRQDWRPRGPKELKRTVADAVLAQYALSEVYSPEVVDAHLNARIHIADVGSPFEWLAASAAVPAAGDLAGWVEGAVLLAHRLGEVVTRELTLTHLVGGAWCSDPGGPLAAARRLLAHPALPRGGAFRLALSMPLLDESGLSEAIVREHWARFRSGALAGLPRLVLLLDAARTSEDAGRKALLPALAAAAETGRIHIAFDRKSDGALITPWYRVPAAEIPDEGALGVGGCVALNLGAVRAETEAQLIDAVDAEISLGLKALRQKRSFMESLLADPSGPLYRVAAGAHPLIATGGGVDLVHLIGLAAAAERIEQRPKERVRLAGRIRSYASVRLNEEGRQMRLRPHAAPERDGEAARRFCGDQPTHGDSEAYALAPEIDAGDLEPSYDAVCGTLTLGFPRESAPSPEALYAALGLLANDPRIGAVRLAPWPDRSVRASTKVAADL